MDLYLESFNLFSSCCIFCRVYGQVEYSSRNSLKLATTRPPCVTPARAVAKETNYGTDYPSFRNSKEKKEWHPPQNIQKPNSKELSAWCDTHFSQTACHIWCWSSGGLSFRLNFRRLLRFVFTPSVTERVKTTWSNHLKFRLGKLWGNFYYWH